MRTRILCLIVAVLSLPALARGQCGTASYYHHQTISYQSAPQLTYAAAPTPAPCACIPSVPASAPMTYATYQQPYQQSDTVDVAALLSLLRSCQTTSYQQTAAIPYAPSYQASYSVAAAPAYLPSYRTTYTRDVLPIHRDYDFRRDFVTPGYAYGGNAFAKSIPIPTRPQLLPIQGGLAPSFAPQPASIFGSLRGRTAAGAGAGGILGAAEGLTGLGDGSGQFLQGALIARFLPGGGGFRFKR